MTLVLWYSLLLGGDTPRTMDIHVRRINGQATDVDVHRTELLTLESQFLAVPKHSCFGSYSTASTAARSAWNSFRAAASFERTNSGPGA